MKTPVQTPYGNFGSIADAARYIARYHGPEFVKTFPQFNYKYDPKLDHYNNETNNATCHYVYNSMRYDILNKVPGWTR